MEGAVELAGGRPLKLVDLRVTSEISVSEIGQILLTLEFNNTDTPHLFPSSLFPQNDMSLFCSISGQQPLKPVVSTKSGQVFEKELVLKYLRDNDQKDPITGEQLNEDDLVEIKTGMSYSLHSNHTLNRARGRRFQR